VVRLLLIGLTTPLPVTPLTFCFHQGTRPLSVERLTKGWQEGESRLHKMKAVEKFAVSKFVLVYGGMLLFQSETMATGKCNNCYFFSLLNASHL
jgi:hypothetical protein